GDMAELLNDDEVALRLRRLPWEREGDGIVREWRFDDFNEAIAFVNRVAETAEEANHHPDIFVHGWNKVKLSLTNSAGGLTSWISRWRDGSTSWADPRTAGREGPP